MDSSSYWLVSTGFASPQHGFVIRKSSNLLQMWKLTKTAPQWQSNNSPQVKLGPGEFFFWQRISLQSMGVPAQRRTFRRRDDVVISSLYFYKTSSTPIKDQPSKCTNHHHLQHIRKIGRMIPKVHYQHYETNSNQPGLSFHPLRNLQHHRPMMLY